MRRFMALLGLGLAVCAFLPATAPAQVVIVGSPPPVVTYSSPPIVTYSSPAPLVVPQSTTTYSYYSAPPVVTYSSPAPLVVPQSTTTYYSGPPVVTYSAPVVTYASPGVVTTRSYYGFGILRPRGWYTETYVRP